MQDYNIALTPLISDYSKPRKIFALIFMDINSNESPKLKKSGKIQSWLASYNIDILKQNKCSST